MLDQIPAQSWPSWVKIGVRSKHLHGPDSGAKVRAGGPRMWMRAARAARAHGRAGGGRVAQVALLSDGPDIYWNAGRVLPNSGQRRRGVKQKVVTNSRRGNLTFTSKSRPTCARFAHRWKLGGIGQNLDQPPSVRGPRPNIARLAQRGKCFCMPGTPRHPRAPKSTRCAKDSENARRARTPYSLDRPPYGAKAQEHVRSPSARQWPRPHML